MSMGDEMKNGSKRGRRSFFLSTLAVAGFGFPGVCARAEFVDTTFSEESGPPSISS